MKINIEYSLPEIWIRIRFHNGSESTSLIYMCTYYIYLKTKLLFQREKMLSRLGHKDIKNL